MLEQVHATRPSPDAREHGAPRCHHCGLPCADRTIGAGDHVFCCAGCRTVFEILSESGLARFYDLNAGPGTRVSAAPAAGRFEYLDDPSIRPRLLDFSDGTLARATLRLPAIHCVACVWLLENLFKLHPAIGASRVNFPRRELTVTFQEKDLPLSRVVELLTSIGYEPALSLANLAGATEQRVARGLYTRLGVAGFAFGNVMLLSFPAYFGLSTEEPRLRALFSAISLLLSVPVLLYSASDYWRAAWLCVRRRLLTIDLPIAIGIVALYGQSLQHILMHAGDGYLDTFTGLIFFLLCGKWFQRRTYERLSFDRDYTSYFPLSVTRREAGGDRIVPITQLVVGDRVVVRNGELIPSDAELVSGAASIDYSFITGEAEPVAKTPGELLHAGGRQVGGALEIRLLKDVAQSTLTSLWNQDAFRKHAGKGLESLTNRVSRWFTPAILAIATLAAAYWQWRDPSNAVRVFVAVLIVACPCALAMTAPFAEGAALRVLGRRRLYLRDASVIEALSGIDTIVFDKTGTLTTRSRARPAFHGAPLSPAEQTAILSLTQHSTHPHSTALREAMEDAGEAVEVTDFRETAGAGIEGVVHNQHYQLGSARWLAAQGVDMAADSGADAETRVWLSIAGRRRGYWAPQSRYRADIGRLAGALRQRYRLAVLSGDTERERATLETLFGRDVDMRFRESPMGKLAFIRGLQEAGRRVMMVGDGLNDAGALKQSDVGVAVSEDTAGFSPACDMILDAGRLGELPGALQLSRRAVAIVMASFVLSFIYNAVGIGFAARGALSPLVAAILMPLSSVSVVAFATGAVAWAGRRRPQNP